MERKIARVSIFSLVLGIGVISLSFAADKPEWLSGDSKRFPPEFYLIGVGQASTVAQANDAARAELAKTIRVSINAQLSSRQTVSAQKDSSGSGSEQVASEAVQRVMSSTKVDLQGIEIAENWVDPDTKENYSFAVLDRKKAEMGLQKDLGVIEQEMMTLIGKGDQGDDVIARIGFMLRAQERYARFEQLNQHLRVVSILNKDRTPPVSVLEIEQKLRQLQQSIIFAVSASGDVAAEAEDAAKGGLAKSGFRTGVPDQAAMNLRIATKLEAPVKKEGWIWIRGVVTASLIDKKTGSQRGSRDWNLKVSASDESLAQQRVIAKVKDTLRDEIGAAVLEFADIK